MKVLKILGIVLIAIVLIGAVLAFIAPKDFKVERSIVIPNSKKEVVYNNLSSWSEFVKWNPWMPMDPNIKLEYKGEAGQIGSSYSWKGNKDVGAGEMTITGLTEFEKVESDLHFLEPFEAKNKTAFAMTPEGTGYKVTWTMSGENSFPMNIFSVFMDMDKMVGPDFEKGLAKLKEKCVNESETVPVTPSAPEAAMRDTTDNK